MKIVYIHGLNSTSLGFNYIRSNIKNNNDILIEYSSNLDLTTILNNIINVLPKKEPLILVGHSLGGVISVLLSSKLKNIEKVITISSPLGGSKAARLMKFMFLPSNMKVISDISIDSPYIKFLINEYKPNAKILSLISVNGNINFPGSEENDSIVSLSSQQKFKHSEKAFVKANHFEILQHPDTIEIISNFIQ